MILKNYLLTLLLTACCSFSYAQGEANNWFFGYNAGVSFNSGTPAAISNGQINTNEGSASISDAQGNLLFYTDGISVWNRNHDIMPGGNNSLNGNPSSTSSGLIVPSPGNSNLYYIFTVDEPNHNNTASNNNGLNYTAIDMTLDNGFGAVIPGQQNIQLTTYNSSNTLENKYKCSEKITAVKSSDCNSFWVITHFTNKFYSFEVNANGIETNPIVSTTPTIVPLSGYRRNAIGYIKSSPDGSKLAVAHSNFATTQGGSAPGGVFLYDFDTTTGIVSNEEEIYNRTNGENPYGVEFSRNGERLYTTVNDPSFNSSLIQLDLTSTDIPASLVIIDQFSPYSHGALQLGPDGKIYRALINFNNGSDNGLGVINNPELLGTACNYNNNAVPLNLTSTTINEEGARLGLPPFIQSLFAEKVDIINNDNDPTIVSNTLDLCQGETYTLAAEDISGATYSWTLDGNPITNTTHDLVDITLPGTYLVEINPNNGDCPFLGEAIVSVGTLPIVNTITPLEQCYDPTDGLSDFTLSDTTTEALAGQNPDVIVASYHTTEANALTDANPIAINYSSAGETIYIRLVDNNTGCINAVPVSLVVNSLPVVNTPVTLEQCDTDTDGSVNFNLNEANSLLSNNSAIETFIYFNTLAEAQANNNPITNATNYTSSTGNSVFAQITNASGCISYGRVNLVVGTSAIPNTLQDSYTVCDDNYDGIATFDFSATHATLTTIFAGVNSTITYYENEVDALAETNAIADISNYQNTNSPNSQTIWVRVDSNDLNGCLGLGEHIALTVNPIPESIVLPDIVGCSDTTSASFDLSNIYIDAANGATNVQITIHETLIDAENGTNPVTNPYIGTAATLYVRAENTTTGCYTAAMTTNLIIQPLPTANTPNSIDKCNDANASGMVEFDLTIRYDDIIGNETDVTVLYFTELADAQVGSGPSLIQDPAHFVNTISPQQIIYIYVVNNTTGCVNNTTLILNILDAPQVYPFTNPLIVCDDDNDGVNYFDLSSLESDITGNVAGVTVHFYETLTQAELGQGAINTGELYQNIDTGTLGLQTLYTSLTINGLDCNTIVDVNLVVLESPELPLGELVFDLCEDNGSADGYTEFDLMDYATATLGLDPTLFDINFYTGIDTDGNPIGYIPNFTNYTNINTPDQVIYIAVSNSNQDSNGDYCTTVRPITLHVNLLPSALVRHDIFECDDDFYDEMDGIYPFDLEAEIFVITGGVTGLGVTFHETFGDAENGINPIANTTAYENTLAPGGTDIFARVYDESTGCYAITHIKLHVDANPTPLSNQMIIDQLGNGGVMEECDGNVDGSGSIAEQVAEFDLTLWETLILTGENGPGVETGVSASYYTSYDDADGGTNAIPNAGAYTNTSNPQTIYVRVTNDGTGIVPQTAGTGCYTIVQFDIYVPVPQLDIEVSSVLCVDENGVPLSGATLPVLSVTPSSADYDYQWSYNNVAIPGATNATYTATEAGVYTVSVSGPTDFDCVNYASVLVEESGMPDGFDANVTTTAFSDNHQIQATATSNIPGIEFYYTLDQGVETNMTGLFTDVAPGYHTVTISDGKGCWSEVVEVLVIDYPHFFTPNGDGINDTWHIIGQEGIPISIIYIFDRYGKLLTQLDPDGAGWDGTYNGHMMPSGDYWFSIQYTEGTTAPTQKEFKAHFSIKR